MQRYFSDEKQDDKFILSKDAWHHIKNVMRMQDGDKIEIVYQNELYICKVNVNDITLVYKKENMFQDKRNIVLIIPILKEQKMDYILQKATELGVTEIIPVQMSRCNINYNHKKELKQIRWQKICQEASQQSKRISVPLVREITNFKHLTVTNDVKILCSIKEKSKSLKKVLKSNCKCDKLYIVFGPEGGFTLEEEEYLKQIGFVSVTLGERILRTETVPLFVLSAINYEYLE